MTLRIDLTRVMAYPVHGPGWSRPAGSRDYLVTTTYDGADLVNGGAHQAIDLGNFRQGDPVRTPISCEVRGYRHWDGALGVGMRLARDWVLEPWHLDRVDVPLDRWTVVGAGVVVGVTGDSGRVLGAHTHLELEHRGIRIDPARYLLGLATLDIQLEDDMQLPEGNYLADGTVYPGVNLREPAADDQLAGSGAVAGQVTKPTTVRVVYRRDGGTRYTVPSAGSSLAGDRWYGVRLPGGQLVEVAHRLVADIRPSGYLASIVPLPTPGLTDAELDRRLDSAWRSGQLEMRARAAVRAGSTVTAAPLAERP